MDNAAFKATFHNFRNVAGRKVMQIHLEVPIEQAGQVYEILGWPDPANPKWVAVALLKDDYDVFPPPKFSNDEN